MSAWLREVNAGNWCSLSMPVSQRRRYKRGSSQTFMENSGPCHFLPSVPKTSQAARLIPPVVQPEHIVLKEHQPLADWFYSGFFRQFSEDNGQFASLFCVQPWLDVPAMGSSLVVTDLSGDTDVPAGLRTVAELWWQHRRDCPVEWTAPEDLLSAIAAQANRPV